jgi:DNA-binding MarR family transcriptional regulator
MADPKGPKDTDQFARLMAQIEALRSRAVQEFARQLSPERRQQIVDALRDALNKLRGREK